MRIETDAPAPVRIAAAVVGLQALGVLAAAVVLLVIALRGTSALGNVYAEAGFFALLAIGVGACGVNLFLGRHGARTPTIVIQILLLGVAWYAIGPSGRPEYGIPVAVVAVAVLVLLLSAPARAWADQDPDQPGDSA